MKKCPYCSAELEDNSSFCLYCMESLDEKDDIIPAKISNKKRRYIVWIIAAFVTLFLILFGLIKIWNLESWLNNGYDNTTTLTVYTDEIKSDNNDLKNTSNATVSKNKSSNFSYVTTSQGGSNQQNQTSKVTSFGSGVIGTNNAYTSSENKTSSEPKPSSAVQISSKSTVTTVCANGHKWVEATCTKPATCSVCEKTSGKALGHKLYVAKCINCGQTDYSKLAGTYTNTYGFFSNPYEDINMPQFTINSSGILSFELNGQKYSLKVVQVNTSYYDEESNFVCYSLNGNKETDIKVRVTVNNYVTYPSNEPFDLFIFHLEWQYFDGKYLYFCGEKRV